MYFQGAMLRDCERNWLRSRRKAISCLNNQANYDLTRTAFSMNLFNYKAYYSSSRPLCRPLLPLPYQRSVHEIVLLYA